MGKGGSTTTTTRQELAPQQRELLAGVIPIAKNYLATPLQMFPGSTIAGPSALQLQGRELVKNAATGTAADLTEGATQGIGQGAATGQTAGTIGMGQLLSGGARSGEGIDMLTAGMRNSEPARNFLLSGALLDPNTNPALRGMVDASIRPLTENLMERILPGIRATAVGNGMLGSSRQGIAEGAALRDYMREAGDIATKLQNNAFNQGLNALTQMAGRGVDMGIAGAGLAGDMAGKAATAGTDLWMKALGLTPEISKLAFMPGMALESLGSVEQQQNQALLTEQANRFTQSQMLPFLQAQDVAQLAFGIGGGSSSSTTSGSQGNGLGAALGMLMMLPFL